MVLFVLGYEAFDVVKVEHVAHVTDRKARVRGPRPPFAPLELAELPSRACIRGGV